MNAFIRLVSRPGLSVVIAMTLGGCATTSRLLDRVSARGTESTGSTSPSPAVGWIPPASPAAPVTTREPLPAGFESGTPVSLARLIDIALQNNPRTRIAWLQARAAEATLGAARSSYLPTVTFDAALSRQKTSASTSSGGQTVISPGMQLNYLLFDFGGREAQVDEARQQLLAADYLHNAAIQDTVLRVEQIYYQYLADQALADAYSATLKELKTNVDVADARHSAGVATIADVLQARTAYSQGELNYESVQGAMATSAGALASALGLHPTTRITLGVLPADLATTQVHDAVESLLAQTQLQRPELAAARAEALRARSRVRAVRAEGLPRLSLAGQTGRNLFSGGTRDATTWSASVLFHVPLFTGFRNTWDIREAQVEEQIALAQVRSLSQGIDLEVWTSYHTLQTAEQRMKTSRDLLTSAQQSYEVAQGRYKAGVGNILDLLTAQASLENARAQEVQARADWLVSVAQLAHDTGTLSPANEKVK